MRDTYSSLSSRLKSVADGMDKGGADRKEMFGLLQSYDYQLGQAVEAIEKLRELVVLKDMEHYGL